MVDRETVGRFADNDTVSRQRQQRYDDICGWQRVDREVLRIRFRDCRADGIDVSILVCVVWPASYVAERSAVENMETARRLLSVIAQMNVRAADLRNEQRESEHPRKRSH